MNSVQCQDEILQMMYWMRGEHVGDNVTPEQLNRFLSIDDGALQSALGQLIARGLVTAAADRYALTDRGLAEAGRRFMDEFSNVLGKEDHLSCSDPNCDCQAPGFEGTCRSVDVHHSS
ncbi:MAG: hypothetical protein M3041_11305 [Acidobacteriota bacterium]|nr:hypothetical protein [Acidobacteriota bacterium]